MHTDAPDAPGKGQNAADEELLPAAAAEILGISASTLGRYAKAGHVPVARQLLGGHRRYLRSDIDALRAKLDGASGTARPQPTNRQHSPS